jgi:hypothetical protein
VYVFLGTQIVETLSEGNFFGGLNIILVGEL